MTENRFDRLTRGNNTEERYLGFVLGRFLSYKLDAPADVRNSSNQALALEPSKNVMNARGRAELELLADLRHRRRDSVRVNVSAKVIEDQSLPGCDHFASLSNTSL